MLYITNEKELDLQTGISVIHFYAPWFIFHSKIANLLTSLEETHTDIKFYAVDIDTFQNYIKRYSLSSLPTIKITKDGLRIRTLTTITGITKLNDTLADIDRADTGEINAQG